jgi:hypothetical protein
VKASILMCIQELSTCKQYEPADQGHPAQQPGYMGMVRQWQEFFYESRLLSFLHGSLPDFVKLSESLRPRRHARSNKIADLEGRMREAFAMKDRLVLHGYRHVDPDRERVPHDRGRQGPCTRCISARQGEDVRSVSLYTMRHIISDPAGKRAGALSRVSGSSPQRGYNIDIADRGADGRPDPVAPDGGHHAARDDQIIEQITKQLNKLVERVKLVDLTEGPLILSVS